MTDLGQAYHRVYRSSKEIIKNKQRHLYPNMLELLSRTTRAAGASSNDLLNEQYMTFWFNEILPLIFDEDNIIREKSIESFDTILPYLEGSNYQNISSWSSIKSKIVENYSKELHNLRQTSNSFWYRIWCLLVRILNKEILKGATVINTFLSIVELGFRSSDYKIRADAFICWKVLVEIFAKHNEIYSPKRIKLICIPLKSSQSKTLETAVNKFKVWWYFICKLNNKIDDYLDTIFEPFLMFCFGSKIDDNHNDKQQSSSKIYPTVTQVAIACLTKMMGSINKETQSLFSSMMLECPEIEIINTKIMLKSGRLIISACCEAINVLNPETINRMKICDNLWRNLIQQIIKTNDIGLYEECLKQISGLMKSNHDNNNKIDNFQNEIILQICEIIGNHQEFPFIQIIDKIDEKLLCNILLKFMEIISNENLKCTNLKLCNIIKNIFNLMRYKFLSNFEKIQSTLLNSLINDNNYKIDFITKFLISKELLKHINGNKNFDLLHRWIFWILNKITVDDTKFYLIDDIFLERFKQFINTLSKTQESNFFILMFFNNLKSLYEKNENFTKFPEILSYFIETLDAKCGSSVLEFINIVLSKLNKTTEQKSNNKIIESLIIFINKLTEIEIIELFNNFKIILSTIIEMEKSNYIEKSCVNNFKIILQDKLKTNRIKDKKYLKEIRDIIKNDQNVFIIIPNVWALNPDKLTEHQKDKMKEKRSDIPALYNDMSVSNQSQDGTIKPWTPTKIVIAKDKNCGEITIETNVVNTTTTQTKEVLVPSEIIISEKLLPETNVDVVAVDKTIIESDKIENTSGSTIKLDKSFDKMKNNDKNDKSKNLMETDEKKLSETKKIDETKKMDKSKDDSKKLNESKKIDETKKMDKSKDDSKKLNESNSKKLKKIGLSKEDAKFLKKLDIEFDDTKKRNNLLKQLKIDAVGGNKIVPQKLRSRNSGSIDDNKKKGRPRSSFSDIQNDNNKKRFEMNKIDKTKRDLKITRKLNESKDRNGNKEEKRTVPKEEKRTVKDKIKNNNIEVNQEDKVQETNDDKNNESTTQETAEQNKEDNMDTTDEVIEPSQTSDTVLSKKKSLRKSLILNRGKSPLIIKKNVEIKKTEDDTTLNTVDDIQNDEKLVNGANLTKKNSEIVQNLANTNTKSVQINLSNESTKILDKPEETIVDKELVNGSTKSIVDNLSEIKIKTPLKEKFSSNSCKIQEKLPIKKSMIETNNLISPKLTNNNDIEIIEQIQCSPIKNDGNILNISKTSLNRSILSSPEFKDTDERNTEFLNNTLNISPILNNNEPIRNGEPVSDLFQEKANSPPERKAIQISAILQTTPPERKQIVPNDSPAARTKTISQFTGRGAQLINMIRNSTKKPEKNGEKSTSPDKAILNNSPKQNVITIGHKDLLTFTKTLPSPFASPSASILKRKFNSEHFDDVESPASKRKRVSFHDPPVSLTKYVKDTEEDKPTKPNINRCLMPEKTSTPQSHLKQSLKRKSRIDSMLEIVKFTDSPSLNKIKENELITNRNIELEQETIEMDSLKWNTINTTDCTKDDVLETVQEKSTTTDKIPEEMEIDEQPNSVTPSPSICFSDENAILNHVFQKYQLDDLLEKYFSNQEKSARILTKELSAIILRDDKIKKNILEILSEKYPSEVLEHAIQENLSSVVCERLNFNSIIDFISEKCRKNLDIRNQLYGEIQNILGLEKHLNEHDQFILTLLKQHNLSNDKVVKYIKAMTQEEDKQHETDHLQTTTASSLE